jgi:glycosyltransferase involved in cell wall biosynthesis
MKNISRNVLLLSDDYLPDSTRNHSKMMHELAVEFISNGHRTYILTPGSETQTKRLEVDVLDDVVVLRFKAPDFRGRGKIWRGINEALLPVRALCALWSSKHYRKIKFDICVNYSPTIFFAPVANFFSKKGTFVYLILRDFFPQWAVDEGILKERSLLTKFFRFVEALNYKASSIIAVQSPANIKVFRKIYAGNATVQVLMNWTGQEPLSKTIPHSLRDSLEIGRDKVIFFYGGNIGHAQDMLNIVKLASKLQHDERVHFLLVGQGDEYRLVHESIISQNLQNVTLLPSVSQEVYREYVAQVDVGIFSLARSHSAHNFPGKLLGYMVEKLPILGSVNHGNDVKDIINNAGAGLISINGEEDILLRDAEIMIDSIEVRRQMGIKSNQLLTSMFSVRAAYDAIWASFLNDRGS